MFSLSIEAPAPIEHGVDAAKEPGPGLDDLAG